MSGETTSLLFVYGTLMSTCRTPLGGGQRARLAGESASLGPATLAGRLYDLGSYPGVVPGVAGTEPRVGGELLELRDPVATFAWLDVYEGMAPPAAADHPAASDGEYRRDILTVTAADGRECRAWVYVYAGPLNGNREIVDGRWAGETSFPPT